MNSTKQTYVHAPAFIPLAMFPDVSDETVGDYVGQKSMRGKGKHSLGRID